MAASEDDIDLAGRVTQFLLNQKEKLGLPDLNIVSQEAFLREAATKSNMKIEDKELLLKQAETVFRELYAHRAFKPAFTSEDPNTNPFIALAEVRQMLTTVSDFDFHLLMLLVFSKARDIHTTYMAPSPYQGAVAFLPFQLKLYEPDGKARFVVAKVMATSENGELDHPHFRVGAEVVEWDALDPDAVAKQAAQLQPGANADAELARGVARLTIRSIASHGVAIKGGIPPFEPLNFATIKYVAPREKQVREIILPWQVATGFGETPFSSSAFSLNESMSLMHRWSKCSYRPDKMAASQAGNDDFFETQFASDAPRSGVPDPRLLRNDSAPGWPLGYLRFRDFAGASGTILEDAKFQQIQDVLARFDREAPGGLILDIRGNPGGQIRLAERVLQLLGPSEIRPLQFHFPQTDVVRTALDYFRSNSDKPARDFTKWLDKEPGDDEGDTVHLTPGRPITTATLANDTGQVYQGPVVLLCDALTYSAADMFAAGFQDHAIGEVIGVDCSTGGGGANSWSFDDIRTNVQDIPGIDIPPLPGNCRLQVAVRRCNRVGTGGPPIEDLGVAPNFKHRRTRRDVLEDNLDLFAFACERLSLVPINRINIESSTRTESGLEVTLRGVGLGFVALRVGGKIVAGGALTEGTSSTFTVPLGDELQVRVEGYDTEDHRIKGAPPIVVPRITLQPADDEINVRRISKS